ncbi:MAG TPA: hypothetical protein VLX09_06700 [Stellaceae bacterium]|nr:hypothetical protein [Stellaceae bacterium]
MEAPPANTPPSPTPSANAPPAPETPAAVEPTVGSPQTPERLIGLNQAQTRGLLGTPTARDEAAPATIWHYAGRHCDLAIYFYLDLKSQVMRALHYEVDAHGSDKLSGERCFAELVAAHQANPEGSAGADPTH